MIFAGYLLLSFGGFVLAHAAVARAVVALRPGVSNQKLLVLLVAAFNLPVLSGLYAWANPGWVDLLYAAAAFNLFAYSYFHLFNMSETSRRIKLLVGIHRGRIRSPGDVRSQYDFRAALEVRIQRLEALSQVRRNSDGALALEGTLLYQVSNLIRLFRTLLGFEGTQ